MSIHHNGYNLFLSLDITLQLHIEDTICKVLGLKYVYKKKTLKQCVLIPTMLKF